MSSSAGSEVRKPRLIAERPMAAEGQTATEAVAVTLQRETLEQQSGTTGRMMVFPPPSTPSKDDYHDKMLATMTALAMILSARAPALLAVIGAFVLALLTISNPTSLSLYISIVFDLCVVCPAIGLYFLKG